jgi:hypothetical protein
MDHDLMSFAVQELLEDAARPGVKRHYREAYQQGVERGQDLIDEYGSYDAVWAIAEEADEADEKALVCESLGIGDVTGAMGYADGLRAVAERIRDTIQEAVA